MFVSETLEIENCQDHLETRFGWVERAVVSVIN